jgi:phospholipid/cholesterol/gamma-HCH transport system substrate-binding protein
MMIFDSNTRENLRQSVANLNATTNTLRSSSQNLEQLLKTNNKRISRILANADSISANLKNNNKAISNSLQNVSSITDSLSKANLTQTLYHLEQTLASADTLVAGIRSGKGSLGKMATDDSLYIQLNKTTSNLNALLEDMKQNPGRYINISVFGKNK